MEEQRSSSCPPPTVLERIAEDETVDESIRAHALTCPSCRAALAEIKRNNELLTELADAHRQDAIGEESRLVTDAIEGYDVLDEIHRGGQGIVYKAVQQATRRVIALKVLLEGAFATTRQRWRFEREIELVANLNHPNIVVVHDSGLTKTGQHYFAMEFIEGRPLTDFAADRHLDTPARLRLLAKVCRAVQYAHRNGIIHRDLKPANILVTEAGEPKILDFGVARATDPTRQTTTVRTNVGQLIGTLAYMSPEQVTGDPTQVDLRSDVYALGVIGYELLAGQPPHDPDRMMLYDAVRAIREDDPKRLGLLDRKYRGDVETIVAKALEKDPARRYQSAADLADDIERSLEDQPIEAHAPSALYQLKKFARRNKILVGAAAAVLLVILAGAAVSTTLAIAEARQRRAAEWQSYLANIVAADAALKLNDTPEARTRLHAAPPNHRNWEWRCLHASIDQSLLVLRGHDGRALTVAYAPDDATIASGSDDRTIRIWDAHDGRQLAVLEGHQHDVWSVVFSPSGDRVASGSWDKTVRLWDLASGRQTASLDAGAIVYSIAFSPDGRRLAAGTYANMVRIWEIAHPQEPRDIHGHDGFVSSVAFSPDGRQLATASFADGTVRLWDAQTGRALRTLPGNDYRPWAVTFSPDGADLACASFDNIVRIWDTATGEQRAALDGHDAPVHAVAFSPNGTRIASASFDKTVRLWDSATGDALAVLRGNEDYVCSVAFSHDGTRIASASFDGTTRLWDVGAALETGVLHGHRRRVNCLAFSPDGGIIASGSDDRTLRLWDVEPERQLAVLHGHTAGIWSVAFNPDGSRIASASEDGTVRLWDAATGRELAVLAPDAGNRRSVSVCFSPDGRRLASALCNPSYDGSEDDARRDSDDGVICLWDPATGELLDEFFMPQGVIWSLAFSPDGSTLAVAGSTPRQRSHPVALWDAASGACLWARTGHKREARAIAFSPDGSLIASASHDRTLRLWDAATGDEILSRHGHSVLLSVAFSPEGSRLALSSADGTVGIWDVRTGQRLLALEGHRAEVACVAFSPDASRLATASGDATLRLWDTLPYRRRSMRRRAAADAQLAAEPIVSELFRSGLDPPHIAQRLRADASLDAPTRRAALNLLLETCDEIRRAVPDAPDR